MTAARRTRMTVLGSLFVCAAAAGARCVEAQTIRGHLMHRGNDQPIDLGLIIMLSENGDSITSTLTQSDGFFEVSSPDPGNYLLLAASLGYREARVGLFELGEGGEITVEFRLWREPLTIDGVMVESLVQDGPLVTDGFYRRMQRGTGHFFTPTDLAEASSARTIDLFHGLSGVRMRMGSGGGERLLLRGASGYCVPTVFIDGGRVTWNETRATLDDIVPFESLRAVEVHRGVSGIPIEFGSFNDCGILVFWTKHR